MAGWRVKSLAEDSVDVYTHTWSVLLFLFLACLLLLVPVTLRPNPQEREQSSPKSAASSSSSLKTTCWCPAGFEPSQIDYTNGVCGLKFIALQEGREFTAASLYAGIGMGRGRGNRFATSPPSSTDEADNAERAAREEDRKKGGAPGHRRLPLPPLSAPVLLFLLAVGLRLPHLVWAMLSCCTSSVNLDQTLLAAKQGTGLEKDLARHIYTRVVQTTLGSMTNCQQRLTSLYLLMKTLMLVVIVTELVLISMHDPLPDGQGNALGQGQQDGGDAYSTRSGTTRPDAATTTAEESMRLLEQQMKKESVMLSCHFLIRHMSTTYDYTVQCMFQKSNMAATTSTRPPDATYYSYAVESVLSNVYRIMFSCLVILAVANGVNTGVLTLNLVNCISATKNRLGLPESSPRDLVLLIHWARTNLGGEVAAGLTEAAGGGGGNDD